MLKEIIRRLIFKLFKLFKDRQNSQMILLNDSIGLEIIYNGYYEKSNLETLKKSFSSNIKNSTFLDIGGPKNEGKKIVMQSSFLATTYRYLDETERKSFSFESYLFVFSGLN